MIARTDLPELETPGAAGIDAGVRLPALTGASLTKADLSEALFDQLGLNKREAKDLVDAFFALLHDDIVNSGDVKLAGFGNFTVRRKAPRPGRNPRTGEDVVIAARQVVAFRPSLALRSLVEGDHSPSDDSV